jgi:HD-like signal output (HDOD) protein
MDEITRAPRLDGTLRAVAALPPLPATAQRLLGMLAQPDVGVDELAELLGLDPPLAARIVGLANAAYFAPRRPIYRVEEAVVRLGLDLVRGLALGMALAGPFDTRRCAAFDLRRYWHGALATALCARQMGTAARSAPPGACFLAGLLRGFGLLVLAHVLPAALNRALTAQDAPLSEALRGELGADHHAVGARVLGRWHLPQEVVEALRRQGAGELPDRQGAWPLAAIVGLAAQAGAAEGSATEEAQARVRALALALGVAEEALMATAEGCPAQRDAAAALADALATPSTGPSAG